MNSVQRVGYGKLGRSMQLDIGRGDMAGNAEAINVLTRLAKRHPDVEFLIIGKNSGNGDFPPNVRNLWPDNVSRASWMFANGHYRCGFCKAEQHPKSWQLDCCDRARELLSLEEYIKIVTAHLDALIIQVGQHGIVHVPIPTSKTSWAEDDRATPYAWARNYGHYLIQAVNKFCDMHDGAKGRIAWLTADPRNFFKSRDIKWPTGATADEPVLAQYKFSRPAKHERYFDKRTPESLGFDAKQVFDGEKWHVNHHYDYCGLELAILPDDWATWGPRRFHERTDIGVATTAAYLPDRRLRRSAMIQDWVFDQFPEAEVYGKWGDKSLEDVTGKVIENNPHAFPELLGSWRCTVSLPPTSTITAMTWAVAKSYQCFAARTVCFFIPPVDDQGWVVPNIKQVPGSHEVASGLWSVRDDWSENELALARWLRVSSPAELAERVNAINANEEVWIWLVETQRRLLQRRWDEKMLETMIEKRVGLSCTTQ